MAAAEELRRLRLLVNDSVVPYTFSNENLEDFLWYFEREGNDRIRLYKTAIMIVNNLILIASANVGKRIKVYRVEKEFKSGEVDALNALIGRLEADLKRIEKTSRRFRIFAGGIYKSNRTNNEQNTDIIPPTFKEKQFDFPEGYPPWAQN